MLYHTLRQFLPVWDEAYFHHFVALPFPDREQLVSYWRWISQPPIVAFIVEEMTSIIKLALFAPVLQIQDDRRYTAMKITIEEQVFYKPYRSRVFGLRQEALRLYREGAIGRTVRLNKASLMFIKIRLQ